MTLLTREFQSETHLALRRIHAGESDIGAGLVELDPPAEEGVDCFEEFFGLVPEDLSGFISSG